MFQTIPVDFSWSDAEFQTTFIVLLATAAFTIYWFIFKSKRIRRYFEGRYAEGEASARFILFTKYSGLVLMGILPLLLTLYGLPHIDLADLGLTLRTDTMLTSLVWIAGLSLLVVPIAARSARQPTHLENYPQIRKKVWTRRLVFHNALAWAMYLLGYEVLFRGILFFPLVATLGFWPATAINMALYSATHIPKGLAETVGAAVLGLVLCVLTALTGTIWVAFFVHLAMAWANSFSALKHHPEMRVG